MGQELCPPFIPGGEQQRSCCPLRGANSFTPFGFAPKGQRIVARLLPQRGKEANRREDKLLLCRTPGGGKVWGNKGQRQLRYVCCFGATELCCPNKNNKKKTKGKAKQRGRSEQPEGKDDSPLGAQEVVVRLFCL